MLYILFDINTFIFFEHIYKWDNKFTCVNMKLIYNIFF